MYQLRLMRCVLFGFDLNIASSTPMLKMGFNYCIALDQLRCVFISGATNYDSLVYMGGCKVYVLVI